ncbi:OmpP1/FadL family transporter [Aquimarina longa]|uniref:OmpP1/FadL family transporter n=1 Tax=Aquimarina longa TaxID=1080221 RepID=UPI000781750B|nr:outer membrane protein transport protein [Aquimarina longa]
MKKLFLLIGISCVSFLTAQDINDALQYSQQDILGTARYRALSGAFGALGGDISALQINPAGSAVFLNSYGSITLSSRKVSNDAGYFGTTTNRDSRNMNFNQIGAVFILNNQNNTTSGINKISYGITYDQTTDAKNKLFASGRSPNSIDRFFLTEAQGLPLNLISRRAGESIDNLYGFLGETESYGTQQAFLGYESFIIESSDPDDLNSTSYISNIASGVFDHEYYKNSTGLNGKLTLNGGIQINQRFYAGLNLNSHFINYDKTTEFFEGNNNTGSDINEVIFTNKLSTVGTGLSLQVGGIAKVSNMVRLGASFESPTWYYLKEETVQRLKTLSDSNGRAVVNPNVVNIFPEYKLRTPIKVTGSIGLLFDQQGLISIDYSYKDYSTTKLSSDKGNDFSAINKDIKTNLQGVSSIKIGTEWRFENWSMRAGYSFEESPYKNDLIAGNKTGYSIGTGYNFGKFRFDITYDYTEQEITEQFFPNSAFNNGTLIDNSIKNITFSLGMNF